MMPRGASKRHNQFDAQNIDPQLAPSKRTSKRYENVSSDRAKQLERNRIAANKCRQKRKQHNEQIQRTLCDETAKHEALLSTVDGLKEELWHLKNQIFNHASCDDPQINFQLAKISQRVARNSRNSLGSLHCPSPTFSASTVSDKSSGDGDGIKEVPQPEATPALMTPEKIPIDDFPDTLFDTFVEAD